MPLRITTHVIKCSRHVNLSTPTMMSLLKSFGYSPGIFQRIQHCTISVLPPVVSFVSSAILKNDSDDKVSLIKCNPFYDKYSKQIAELQEKRPDDLLVRLKTIRKGEQSQASSGRQKHPLIPSFTRRQTSLNDVIEVEPLQNKSAEEITEIWMKLFKRLQDCIFGVISDDAYNLIEERGLLYPTFLLPLPRDQGYEYIVSQFSGSEIHFTPLILYQTYKENAPECLSIKHYTDLKTLKRIVLMKGEFNKDIINYTEAACLANQLQRYYGEKDDQRLRLLQRFNQSPDDFQHIDLIVELERLAS